MFGGFAVSDEGLTVRPKGLFKGQRSEFFEWAKLKWGIVNGNLVFTKADSPEKSDSERFVPVDRQRTYPERRPGAPSGTRGQEEAKRDSGLNEKQTETHSDAGMDRNRPRERGRIRAAFFFRSVALLRRARFLFDAQQRQGADDNQRIPDLPADEGVQLRPERRAHDTLALRRDPLRRRVVSPALRHADEAERARRRRHPDVGDMPLL